MARVLVTEQLAVRGLDLLAAAGHHVDEQLDLDPAGLIAAIPGAAALIIRSRPVIGLARRHGRYQE